MSTEGRSFEELVEAVREELPAVCRPSYQETWLSTPNERLENQVPLDLLRQEGEEGYSKVHALIESTKHGNF